MTLGGPGRATGADGPVDVRGGEQYGMLDGSRTRDEEANVAGYWNVRRSRVDDPGDVTGDEGVAIVDAEQDLDAPL